MNRNASKFNYGKPYFVSFLLISQASLFVEYNALKISISSSVVILIFLFDPKEKCNSGARI